VYLLYNCNITTVHFKAPTIVFNECGVGVYSITVFEQILLGISGKWFFWRGILVFEFHSVHRILHQNMQYFRKYHFKDGILVLEQNLDSISTTFWHSIFDSVYRICNFKMVFQYLRVPFIRPLMHCYQTKQMYMSMSIYLIFNLILLTTSSIFASD